MLNSSISKSHLGMFFMEVHKLVYIYVYIYMRMITVLCQQEGGRIRGWPCSEAPSFSCLASASVLLGHLTLLTDVLTKVRMTH